MTDGGYTQTEAWNLQLQAKVTRLERELSDCTLAREQLAAEVERLRKNVECLTNNKWSEIEIALGEKEGHDLWMKLHNITSLDDLRRDAERATAAEAALAEAVKERDAAWNNAIEAAARKLGCRNKFTETEAVQIIRALKDSQC